MKQALRDASQETKEEHEKLMTTTRANVDKEREREEDKKIRKIASLTETPTTEAPHKAESPKGEAEEVRGEEEEEVEESTGDPPTTRPRPQPLTKTTPRKGRGLLIR